MSKEIIINKNIMRDLTKNEKFRIAEYCATTEHDNVILNTNSVGSDQFLDDIMLYIDDMNKAQICKAIDTNVGIFVIWCNIYEGTATDFHTNKIEKVVNKEFYQFIMTDNDVKECDDLDILGVINDD